MLAANALLARFDDAGACQLAGGVIGNMKDSKQQ
jgi:hypothetical protein